MNLFSLVRPLCLAVAVFLGITTVEAAEVTTSINVQGMHCVMCARKITAQLQAVPESGQIAVNPETGLATIAPKAQAVPSPRSLWEAVERAGYKPVQITSPYGTFRAKPKS